jgi:hypothetical protein
MATRPWRGAGDEGAAGVAAPAIALRAWILLTPAMFSGRVVAAFALARTAGRTQLERRSCVAPSVARVGAEYCDRVLRIPKAGKRAAIAAGLRASDPETAVVVVLDADAIARGTASGSVR